MASECLRLTWLQNARVKQRRRTAMQLNSDYYDTDFEFTYKGNKILIRNDGPEGESLFVNGVLQDQNFSAHNGHLIGHIFDGENKKETVEVFLGGRETRDCMIYANGDLIHSHISDGDPADRYRKEPVNKKKTNSILLPFFVIVLITASIILLRPYLYGVGSSGTPEDTVPREEDGTTMVSGTEYVGSNTGDPDNSPDNDPGNNTVPEQYIEVSYVWHYGKDAWTYDLKIPESAYQYYKTVDRKKIINYGYYVTDPEDDEYMAELAVKFKEAAEKGNYSALDMVKNIIFFVQNLNYVDDKVGTGYDEYPKFPLETLADEGGDCEDSAILLASLLRELDYGTVLIQFKDHMAVGVKGESSIPGSYFEVDGSRYYYVETTSPGWDIGEVPDLMKEQQARILTLN